MNFKNYDNNLKVLTTKQLQNTFGGSEFSEMLAYLLGGFARALGNNSGITDGGYAGSKL